MRFAPGYSETERSWGKVCGRVAVPGIRAGGRDGDDALINVLNAVEAPRSAAMVSSRTVVDSVRGRSSVGGRPVLPRLTAASPFHQTAVIMAKIADLSASSFLPFHLNRFQLPKGSARLRQSNGIGAWPHVGHRR